MMKSQGRRSGVSFADILLGMGVACVLIALAYPTFRAHGYASTVERAVNDVDALAIATRGIYERTGEWPPAGRPGEIPEGTRGAFPQDSTLTRDGYSLQWLLLESAVRVPTALSTVISPDETGDLPESVDLPTEIEVRILGRVVLNSADDALLAEMLARYGADRSFVRDSTWTLVLPSP